MGNVIKFLMDELKKNRMTDNKGVRVERRSEGCKLNLNFSSEEPENGQTAYEGPFAVSNITEDETPELRVAAGTVCLGTEKLSFLETDLVLTDTGVLYLDITYDSGYAAVLWDDTEMPDQDNDHLYIQLAAFTFNDDDTNVSIDWSWTGGQIYAAGRAF